MRHVLLVVLLLIPLYAAVSVELSPNYARMPTNSTQTFTVNMEGDGKVYELKLFGSYLDWQTQKVWVGPSGKTLYVEFYPLGEGEYTITADFEDARDEATAVVYKPQTNDLWTRIQELRVQLSDSESIAKLNEAERLYNESRFELAELKLGEVELALESVIITHSELPKFFLAGLIAIISIVAAKLLLG
ncbi:MAG: hypothetical protein GOV01_02715 [Candidatus Altiarchaeota archaeon]|nr:hypothetical protein [Candidatus Altiarchaeota archaeon]